jgi:DNA invertase Pin-like site-specific DNA recombinase
MTTKPAKFVAYLRISKKGGTGLGISGQREAIKKFVADRGGKIIAPEFVEEESGKKDDRPELVEAIKRCRLTGATLVVAKLDRLSRDAAFLMTLQKSSVAFVAADLPDANTMTVGVMATVAQYEREAISARTKTALAAAKARGTKLGGHRDRAPDITQYHHLAVAGIRRNALKAAEERRDVIIAAMQSNATLSAIASHLNEIDVRTSRNSEWTATAVKRTLARLNLTMQR